MSTASRLTAARAGVLHSALMLLRPRVASMVFLVAFLGALLGSGALGAVAPRLAACAEAAFYVTLVTGCASILNQVLERDTDALMERTKGRPLVTGAVQPATAIAWAVLLGALGTVGLAWSCNLLSALLTLATLVAYVAVYTPLKRVSTLNTVVGAVPGAAPPLLGYVALAGAPGPWAWSLFALLFAWQFPHFMAIAWLYRADYARAGHRMLPALPGADGVAGRQAVLYGLALIPVSLMPAWSAHAGPLYVAGVLVLGLAYLGAAVAFALRENRARARALLLVSLAYLPLLFALILLDPMVRAFLTR
jgi:protoheme IX farnesyltransferase